MTEMIDSSAIQPQVLSLRVTNMNEFVIVDRFDGTMFTFKPAVQVDVPIDAAYHIFGWFPPFTDKDGTDHVVDPEVMRRHCQRRFGWNTPEMVKSGAHDLFFDQITFKPIMYRMVPVPVEEENAQHLPDSQIPARAPKVNKMMAAADAAAARNA